MFHVCALYQFIDVRDVPDLHRRLTTVMDDHCVVGTLLVAPEGINGTIAGEKQGVDAVLAEIEAAGLRRFNVKWSTCEDRPFKRAKVRIKREIVTMGVPTIDARTQAGIYVEPEQWNRLIDEPNVVVIDTRNDYETTIGKFEGAIQPGTESFREFPDYVDQHLDPSTTPKVAMYCTGGIRCEKATAYLKQRGFQDVYHLRGGILEYLRTVDPAESRWRGDCFVFDDRVAVDHQLQPSGRRLCHACGWSVDQTDMADPKYQPGVQCPRCASTLTDDQRSRFAMRQSQIDAGD